MRVTKDANMARSVMPFTEPAPPLICGLESAAGNLLILTLHRSIFVDVECQERYHTRTIKTLQVINIGQMFRDGREET